MIKKINWLYLGQSLKPVTRFMKSRKLHKKKIKKNYEAQLKKNYLKKDKKIIMINLPNMWTESWDHGNSI